MSFVSFHRKRRGRSAKLKRLRLPNDRSIENHIHATYVQASPLLRDKRRFVKLADPLLGRRYPVKGLYQALAVASMCLQEDAASRPGISDVVAALSFLADPQYYPPEGMQAEHKSPDRGSDKDSSPSPPKADMIRADDEMKHR